MEYFSGRTGFLFSQKKEQSPQILEITNTGNRIKKSETTVIPQKIVIGSGSCLCFIGEKVRKDIITLFGFHIPREESSKEKDLHFLKKMTEITDLYRYNLFLLGKDGFGKDILGNPYLNKTF